MEKTIQRLAAVSCLSRHVGRWRVAVPVACGLQLVCVSSRVQRRGAVRIQLVCHCSMQTPIAQLRDVPCVAKSIRKRSTFEQIEL